MLDGLVNAMDSFFVWLNSALKQNLADYSDLETAQDNFTLVNKNGSLLSIIRVDGYRSLINVASFYDNISAPFASGLSTNFRKAGHMMQIYFSLDPSKSERMVKEALAPSYETIKKLELDLQEILDERVKNISSIANYEECYLVLWTLPSALAKMEAKNEKEAKRKLRMGMATPVGNGQDPLAGNLEIRNLHNSYVESVFSLMNHQIGLACEKVPVREAVRCMRASVDDDFTGTDWSPSLPGDPIMPNVRRSYPNKEEWDIVWPKISWQVCPRDAKVLDDKLVQVGDKVFAPAYVDLFPKNVKPFSELFSNLLSTKYPWRIVFTIEGDGVAAVSARGLFASILAFTSGENKLLNEGVKFVKEISNDFTIVKARIAFCTWADKSQTDELRARISEVARSVQGWGGCLVSEVTGDPVAGFISTALGVNQKSIATTSAVPLEAISFMAPINRPSSPWTRGSVLLLSPDKKLMPYQPGSSEQTTWIQLIFAKPGSGKSVLMNVTNLALCLAPGITRLPRIGIVDIGPSSSGLISLIKEGLPANKRHLAQYYRLRMTEEFCVNPWDTQLGCRFPTAAERTFLINFLLLLTTDPNKETPEDGMTGLCTAIVDDMYMKASDKFAPKRYYAGFDIDVDNAVKDIGMQLDEKTTWWEVVDALFNAGNIHAATLAQRYAVPVLADAASSAQDERIKETVSGVKVGTGESLVQYFNRALTDALNQYRILAKPTRFDIGEARIVSLDLDEVAKTGGTMADRQTAIMYMLARYILGKDFKLDKDSVNEMPYPAHLDVPAGIPANKYREYHKTRAEEIKEDFKRLCFDEFHRTSKSQLVRDQIIVDMREGRKWNLDVTLASQSVKDFDETMKSFATGIFIMDGGNERDVEEIADTFGVEDNSEKYALTKGYVHGPRQGRPGVFMAKFVTNNGKYTQLLSAYIGAIEMWALSTTAEDVVVRNKLYEILGPAPARAILAKEYPRGVKKIVEMRKEAKKSSGAYFSEEDGTIYEQIVDEILVKAGYKKGVKTTYF